MQHGLVDAVVLGVVLPGVFTFGDLAQDLATVDLGGGIHHGVEARLDGVDAVALVQLRHPPSTHQARGAFGVEIGGQRVGHAGIARHDRQRSLVGYALIPQLDRRNHQALFVHGGGTGRHGAGAAAADVVVMAEGLHESNDRRLGVAGLRREHRHRDTEIRQVADATLGEIDVVVEVDVTRLHGLQREVAGNRMHQRGVGTPRQLAQIAVVDSGAEIVGVTNHRGPRRPRNGRLHFHFDACEVAGHDLDENGIRRRRVDRREPVGLVVHHVDDGHQFAPFESRVRVMRTLPNVSMRAEKPGSIGTVELNSSMTAGPVIVSPAPRSARL
ncbi:unannotated protein [freshwater metagenome]|uniref:Unannotated protein n=1 Tax=freshwater metagenome TaxID=449393 RepID=A0A6J7J1V8_9ZZZZ